MLPLLHARATHYLLLTAVAGFLFFNELGGAALWDLDEGRNATAALEMMESGNWVVPTFNGELRAHKPALLYWLQVTAYRLFGVSEFSARLPSALAALLTLFGSYELGRAMFGVGTGLLGSLVLASTPMLCGAARFANPDALLTLFTVLTMAFLWLVVRRGSLLAFVLVGLAAGLGILAKGPVGFVLPAGIIGVFLIWERRWSLLLDPRWALAVVVMLAVSLPWFIWVAIETRASFLQGFIMHHNVDRFLSPMENHRGSVFYYVLVLFVGMAPWTVFTGPTLWYSLWSTLASAPRWGRTAWEAAVDRTQGDETTAPYRFLTCWAILYFLFFSAAATKLPNYVLPVAIPCALLLARYLERWRLGLIALPRWVMICSLTGLLLIGVGLGLGLAVAGGLVPILPPGGRAFPELAAWALLGIWPALGAGAAAWCWLKQQRTAALAAVVASAVLMLGPLAAFGNAAFNRYKCPRPLFEMVGNLRPEEEIRVGAWNLDSLPSLNFYFQRDVTSFPSAERAAAFLSYPLPVYLCVSAEDWPRLEDKVLGFYRIAARHTDLYRNREILVVTNR